MKSAFVSLLCASLLVVAGCKNRMHDQNLKLHAQNRELQQRANDLEGELGNRPDKGQMTQMERDLADRDAQLQALQEQLKNPPPTQPPAGTGGGATKPPTMAGVETEYDAGKGEMTVRVSGDVLFDSGMASVKKKSEPTLDTIAAALTSGEYSGKAIRIEGHTDNDPLVKTKKMWGDNRNLSINRAQAVARYLEGKGVDSNRIVTTGFGESRPRGADKAKNRRVEIVVVTR